MQSESINVYTPFSREDEEWGLYLMDVGRSRIIPGDDYPVGAHPPDYVFNFSRGRVLQEYQVLYITEGEGEFDSESAGRLRVEPGSVLILFPGERHWYRPLKSTGWKEYWIGFNGAIADRLFSASYFNREEPVLNVGIHSRLNEIYDQVLMECRQGDPGFHQVAAGKVLELLGLVRMYLKNRSIGSRSLHSQIFESRQIIEDRFKDEVDPKAIAAIAGLSYSTFRKSFKLFTGLSPGQYIIHLRIREAKSLLYSSNLTIKEIADRSGFKSSYYFVRLFKEKVGLTPGNFRKKARGHLVSDDQ